ncbi:MAG: hypothetical protein DMF93_21380 [Acidobacteria bacterium]|nr:MAG: hypothetical protein DMF93_21380 [Acidobacteriota bacterium]
MRPPTPPAAAPIPAPFLPPDTAPTAAPAPALPPMISASFSHDRLFVCAGSVCFSTMAGDCVISSRVARSLTRTGWSPSLSRT